MGVGRGQIAGTGREERWCEEIDCKHIKIKILSACAAFYAHSKTWAPTCSSKATLTIDLYNG